MILNARSDTLSNDLSDVIHKPIYFIIIGNHIAQIVLDMPK